jgi:cell division protein FtsL
VATTVQFTWQKRIDNRRLVRERDPGYVREWAGLILGALVCLTVVLVCAWQQFEYVRTGYQLEELRTRHEQVQDWNRTLRLEHATLTDPMRIDAWARNQLGLETPHAGQLIPASGERPVVQAPVWARAAKGSLPD